MIRYDDMILNCLSEENVKISKPNLENFVKNKIMFSILLNYKYYIV